MTPSLDRPRPNPAFHRPMRAARPRVDDSRPDLDVVSQEALAHYLAARAAVNGRRMPMALRAEWTAAAVGLAWLLVSLGALLVSCAAFGWP